VTSGADGPAGPVAATTRAHPEQAGKQSPAHPSDHTLNPAGKEAAEKADRTPLTFHALTPDGNERFHDAITAAEVA
jgi:hypothetical protein